MYRMILCLFLVAVVVSSAWAETHIVDLSGAGDFATIQGAANVAADADTILVRPGVYYENVVFPEPAPSVSLIGEDPATTIIDAGGTDKCILVKNWSGSSGLVQGFTLRNSGTGSTGGISNCGLAIHTNGSGSWVIRGNTFSDHPHTCLITSDGGLVSGNLFLNAGDQGVFVSQNGSVTILGNTFVECRNAVYAHWQASGVVVTANIAVSGVYGIAVGDGVPVSLSCNDLWEIDTPYSGCAPGDCDLALNPLFCGPELDDYSLQDASPCLPGNHPQGCDCGLIGAFPEGCAQSPVTNVTWGAIKLLYQRGVR